MICCIFPLQLLVLEILQLPLMENRRTLHCLPGNYNIVDGSFEDDEDDCDHSSNRFGYLNENQQHIPTA
jgi:hypothetical protein